MNKIPAEIFSVIISHLHVFDKLECIRVCKKWHELITSTNLYDTLKFRDSDNFDQALTFFNKYRHMGQQVRGLSIVSLDVDIQVVLSLPHLFPNLKTLDWKEKPNCVRFIGPPTESIYQQALSNWQHLQHIKDTPMHLDVSTTLLGSHTCRNLTHLNVSFHGRYIDQEDIVFAYNGIMLEALLNNIHNAPSLQSITLSDTPMKLNDLEHMHNNLPELRDIKLDSAYLNGNDELSLIGGGLAKNLRSLYLKCYTKDQGDINALPFCRTIVNWLSYIGQKYQNVQNLEIKLNGDETGFNQTNNIERHLVSMVSNMKRISTYLVGLCPLSEDVLYMMDRNDVELKKVKLVLLNTEQVPQLFQLVESSRPASTLEYLAVDSRHVDTAVMRHALIRMVNRLNHLTALQVDNVGKASIVVDILQNLTSLESLEINRLIIIVESSEDRNYFSNTIAKPCRIKDLKIYINSIDRNYNQLDKISSLFDFILRSCPLLESAILTGNILSSPLARARQLGALNLDFRQNPRMKLIFIDILGCSYYISNKTGQRWQYYGGEESTFFVKLDWIPPIQLILAKGNR